MNHRYLVHVSVTSHASWLLYKEADTYDMNRYLNLEEWSLVLEKGVKNTKIEDTQQKPLKQNHSCSQILATQGKNFHKQTWQKKS